MTSRRALAAVFLVSLALNLSYLVAFGNRLTVHGDAEAYDKMGIDLAQGEGFPTTGGLQPKREPGYPIFLAAVYMVAGHAPTAVRAVQALLASTLCLLVFLLARQLARAGTVPASLPIVAAALTAGYPPFIFYGGELMRETVFTWLTLLAFVALTAAVLEGRLRHAVIFGAASGLAALVDARLMYFPVFFGIVTLVAWRDWRRSLRFVAVSFGLALLVVLPWAVRNYVVLHRFVLLTASPYKGLWLVTNPDEFLEWDWEREPLKSLRWLPPEERDRALSRLAVENLVAHPGTYLASMPARFIRLWTGGHSEVVPPLKRSLASGVATRDWDYVAVKSLFVGLNFVYLVGGIIGAVLCLKRGGARWGLHLIAFGVYLSILHSLLFATPRYHLPAMPLMIVLFAFAATSWLGARRTAREPLRAVARVASR